ncbi:MAG: hypothetical protein EAZ63_03585 [Runella slithyformis]|nr:MAG: hypothetical protein EAZ63_03585 [Runella slithyformis]
MKSTVELLKADLLEHLDHANKLRGADDYIYAFGYLSSCLRNLIDNIEDVEVSPSKLSALRGGELIRDMKEKRAKAAVES